MLGDEDQIENVNNTIAVGIGSGFAEVVGDLYEIQDVDTPIAVDIGGIFGFQIDFTVEVGEQAGGSGSYLADLLANQCLISTLE